MSILFSERGKEGLALPSHGAGISVGRRQFLTALGAGLVLGAAGCRENKKASPATKPMHYESAPANIDELKFAEREKYAEGMQTLLKIGVRENPSARRHIQKLAGENYQQLYKLFAIYFGCMDEGEETDNLHKFGIAGAGAGMDDRQRHLFGMRVRSDQNLMKRVQGAKYHQGCAAVGKDEEKGKLMAQQLLEAIGLAHKEPTLSTFSDMRRSPHVHPAMAIHLEHGNHLNEQYLRVPMLTIGTQYVPEDYVDYQVQIAKKVVEGPEGMVSVMEANDPLALVISAPTRAQAEENWRKYAPSFKGFKKEPVPVLLVGNELKS